MGAQIGYSSEPGQGAIVPFKEYDRKFSPHLLDWVSFGVMSMPSLLLPFFLWFSSKSKMNENIFIKERIFTNPRLKFCIVQFVCNKNFQSECVIKTFEGACWLTQI